MGTLERLKALHGGYTVYEGSYAQDVFEPVAAVLDMLTDEYLPAVLDSVMPDTAVEDDLDRVGVLYGVARKPAALARGAITLRGATGTAIPVGTAVSTASGLAYMTQETVTIPQSGAAEVAVIAKAAGAAYNVAEGAVNASPLPLPGGVVVTNAKPITGGADDESDDAYRARILRTLRTDAASGTKDDYIRWALETPGVLAARCLPVWNGPGTVKVILIGDGMQPAGGEIVSACRAHIETLRPVGAFVTVAAAAAKKIDVTAKLTCEDGYTADALGAPVKAALAEALKRQAEDGEEVSIAKLGAALLDVPGVKDYKTLKINGGTVNVSVATEAVPVIGEVTLS